MLRCLLNMLNKMFDIRGSILDVLNNKLYR